MFRRVPDTSLGTRLHKVATSIICLDVVERTCRATVKVDSRKGCVFQTQQLSMYRLANFDFCFLPLDFRSDVREFLNDGRLVVCQERRILYESPR